LPYMEQTNLYNVPSNTGAAWNSGANARVVKQYLCPSDTTHNNGLALCGAGGWAGVSYAPVHYMFGPNNSTDPGTGQTVDVPKYTIGNIPDGTSNQVGIVERFVSFPNYNWSNTVNYPQMGCCWGWNSNGSAYGPWGLGVPQVNQRINQPVPHTQPSTAHASMQTLIMDGGVRSITSAINPNTWSGACQPDDGAVLGSNW